MGRFRVQKTSNGKVKVDCEMKNRDKRNDDQSDYCQNIDAKPILPKTK